jgi:hypothetical protein
MYWVQQGLYCWKFGLMGLLATRVEKAMDALL